MGEAWRTFRNDLPRGDLIPQRQTRDDQVGYFWPIDGGAHVWINNIRFLPVDPSECDMRDRIVLASELRAREALPFSNPTREVQETTITHTSGKGGSEIKAITAGFSKKVTVSAKVSGGIDGIAKAEASVVDETTITSAYKDTTGRTYEESAARGYKLRQPAYTAGEGRLTWTDQTCQTRVRGLQAIDCEIEIYWWKAYRKYDARKARKTTRHRKSHRVVFQSAHQLIAMLEGRGSVHTPFFEHFAGRGIKPWHIDDLKGLLAAGRRLPDRALQRGFSEFKTEIVNLVQLDRPDAEDVSEERTAE